MTQSFFKKTAISASVFIIAMAGVFFARSFWADLAAKPAGYYFNGGAYDLKLAETFYRVAAFFEPESPFFHYQLARVFFVENKLMEAKSEIDLALNRDPANQRAFYIRGLIDGFAGEYNEAVADFEKFTAWSPEEWAGWNDLAWANYKAGDFNKAREAALAGLKISEANPWLLNNLGLAYAGLGEEAKARKALEAAKKYASSLAVEDWRAAYPGNDPTSDLWSLAEFRSDLRHNAALVSQADLTASVLSKGIASAACAASVYGSCSSGNCYANSCVICDSYWDQIVFTSSCCATSQCSNYGSPDLACPVPKSLSVSKTGSGTVAGTSINCGTACSAYYEHGTAVSLSATSDFRFAFTGWSGACSGTGVCSVTLDADKSVTANFGFINHPPVAADLTMEAPDYTISGPAATFFWSFSDQDADMQRYYQIQISTQENFAADSIVLDTLQLPYDSNSYATGPGKLLYNEKYYWRLKVWDVYGADSGWIYPPSTDKFFRTPAHQYPSITDIRWAPVNPSVNEEVVVSAVTKCYEIGGGEVACPASGFKWIFANGVPATVNGEVSPRVKFSLVGASDITLNLTDADNYPATRKETISCRLPLPGWKETAPQ